MWFRGGFLIHGRDNAFGVAAHRVLRGFNIVLTLEIDPKQRRRVQVFTEQNCSLGSDRRFLAHDSLNSCAWNIQRHGHCVGGQA
jgi:hypothetical protein